MENLEAKILLAEDRIEDAHLTDFALENAGYKGLMHWVKDGQEVLDYLYCRGDYKDRPMVNPKLILLDLKMPKLNGLEVLNKVKNDDALLSIPIVMLTTSKEELDRTTAYKNHVNSYIVKPVDSEKFSEVVMELGNYWLRHNLLTD